MKLIDNFQPPDGSRLIWHGLKQKQLWEPRINQISNGQSERERQSVLLGFRKLTLQPIQRGFPYERIAEWARNHGLSIMPVRAVGRFDGFAHRYTAGEDMYVTAIASKPEYAESPEPELYLGFPECCQRFFAANFPKYIDPIWQWAGEQSEVTAHPYSNPLLRYWSLRFVPHIPCSPQCEESILLGTKFAELMTAEERDWLWELLSSPIEWSCLHGVAEIKTEWFRIIVGSNPSTKKYNVKSKGISNGKQSSFNTASGGTSRSPRGGDQSHVRGLIEKSTGVAVVSQSTNAGETRVPVEQDIETGSKGTGDAQRNPVEAV